MTDRFVKLALLCALSVPILCQAQQAQPGFNKGIAPVGMTSIVNTVTIAGDPEAVFDLITTSRFWPLWHPASMAVGGVTERPYGLGDKIREGAKIGSQSFHVTWTVLEHVRPSRVVLQTEDAAATITYSFKPKDHVTEFSRKLEFKPVNSTGDPNTANDLKRLMEVQSEQAVKQLKDLVEKILRIEGFGIE